MSFKTPIGMQELPNDWKWVLFEEVCEKVSVGYVGQTSSYFCDDGVPFIRSQNVRKGILDLNDIKHVTYDFHNKSKKSKLLTGDILIVRVGQNRGDCAVLPSGLGEINCANIVFARPEPEYSSFLGYFFNSNIGRKSLLAVSTGSAQLVLNTKSVAKVYVPIPPKNIAKKIAHILSTLDDKIELNRKMNQTLEEMAQALFKSWFVDFDPVHAKADVKSDEALESAATELGISKEVLELFPSEFEESEMGMIPKGWEVKPISEVSSVAIGKTPPRKEPQWFTTENSDVKWISIKDMGNNGMYIIETNEYLTSEAIEKFNVKVIPPNTALLSFKLTLGRVSITTEEMTTNEAIAHFVLEDGSLLSTEYIYCYLKNFDYSMLGSTSSIATAINSKIVKTIPTIVATESIIQMFDSMVDPMFKQILSLTKETEVLENTRDTLLPKLLSGELEVSNIEFE